MHMLASQGYCVICIDSRGSRHRGAKFESHIRHRMGTVELADQVEVLKILSEALGYIDMNRVAIHGWSYGKFPNNEFFEQRFLYKFFLYRWIFESNGINSTSRNI